MAEMNWKVIINSFTDIDSCLFISMKSLKVFSDLKKKKKVTISVTEISTNATS